MHAHSQHFSGGMRRGTVCGEGAARTIDRRVIPATASPRQDVRTKTAHVHQKKIAHAQQKNSAGSQAAAGQGSWPLRVPRNRRGPGAAVSLWPPASSHHGMECGAVAGREQVTNGYCYCPGARLSFAAGGEGLVGGAEGAEGVPASVGLVLRAGDDVGKAAHRLWELRARG